MRIYTIALSSLLLICGAANSPISELRSSDLHISNSEGKRALIQTTNDNNCDDSKGGDNRCDYRGSGRLMPKSPDKQLAIANGETQPNDDAEQRGSGRMEAQANATLQLFAESEASPDEGGDEAHRASGRLEA